MAFTIREKPPLRVSVLVTDPSGRSNRWAADEASSENVPKGLQLSSTAPGGWEGFSCSLPRRPGVAYSDLTPFSNIYVQGAGGCAGEFRLEDAPRESGNERNVSVRGVGHQAHLDDDKSAAEIYIDQEVSKWGEPTTQRQENLRAASFTRNDVGVSVGGQDAGAASPGITFAFQRFVSGLTELGEVWYNGHGVELGKVRYDFDTTSSTDTAYVDQARLSSDDLDTSSDAGTDHNQTDATNQTVTATTSGRKWAAIQSYYGGGFTGDTLSNHSWRNVKVFGNHGLTERGTWPDIGLYASDAIAHALRSWAPLLSFTEGSTGTLTPTSFIIPQLAFADPTTCSEILRGANRFHLRDWFVWEGQRPGRPTFYYHDRGARGKNWRARIRPAQLQETGVSAQRIWNGVIVRYQDVTGETRSVGPVGSGANTESSDLEDADPLNPANQKGIRRWDVLDMGGVSTPAGATEVGRRFLEEANQLDSSGQASLVGYVTDDKGVEHPAWRVRAGDTISFVDAADSSPRRVVRAAYDHDAKTCSVDLDAPPEGLAALLERLQVVLLPLGL
jgi:hypothetical protein